MREAAVSKYNLSNYFAKGKQEIRTYGNKKYAIQQYQGNHEDEYTVMEVDENGIENGMAQLFKNGIIQLSWKMENGKRCGTLTIYKNGVVNQMTTWESLDDNIIRSIVNDESGKRLLLERSVENGFVIYKGEYDGKSLARSGWGIEYDNCGVGNM